MNEVCKIKPFMISTTLGTGLIRHPWFTRVILLASKGQFTWVRTVGMGPSGATITTVMYPASLRSQQFSNVLQALYAAAELWEENRPWAQVHFCFTDSGPTFALVLCPRRVFTLNLNLLSGSGSARNLGFSHFFLFSPSTFLFPPFIPVLLLNFLKISPFLFSFLYFLNLFPSFLFLFLFQFLF